MDYFMQKGTKQPNNYITDKEQHAYVQEEIDSINIGMESLDVNPQVRPNQTMGL